MRSPGGETIEHDRDGDDREARVERLTDVECCKPASTSWPRPSAPTSAAITTMPNARLIVWLTPSSNAGRATGTWIFQSDWRGVAPCAVPTSTNCPGTPRSPCSVSRIAGGSAKITVAMTAGG